MRFTVTAIIEFELLSRFDCRLLAWCVFVYRGAVLLMLRKERTGSVAKE